MVTSSKQEELMAQKGYISVRRVAEQSGIHPTTIYRAIRDGSLKELGGPGVKFVKLADVVAWLGPEKAAAAGFVRPSDEPKEE